MVEKKNGRGFREAKRHRNYIKEENERMGITREYRIVAFEVHLVASDITTIFIWVTKYKMQDSG